MQKFAFPSFKTLFTQEIKQWVKQMHVKKINLMTFLANAVTSENPIQSAAETDYLVRYVIYLIYAKFTVYHPNIQILSTCQTISVSSKERKICSKLCHYVHLEVFFISHK